MVYIQFSCHVFFYFMTFVLYYLIERENKERGDRKTEHCAMTYEMKSYGGGEETEREHVLN